MKENKVNVKLILNDSEKICEANIGDNLLDIIRKNNIDFDTPCNGNGSCGKCRCKIKENTEIGASSKKHLNKSELISGIRLACDTEIKSDLTVELSNKIKDMTVLISGVEKEFKINPSVQKHYIVLEKPTLDDQRDDLMRIKDFLKEYNSLINEMTSLYNADSAKGYEPLTTEEKDAMTDSEVEEWEKKVKSALLRRDDSLGNLLNSMTSAMYKGYTVNGKSYSLSSFGISTLGYLNADENEENAYHIDGDADDSAVSSKTNKLKQMLQEDPDTVTAFMQQLVTGVYNEIDTKMRSNSLSSAMTVYNDKQMAKEYSNYTTTIKKWEDKITSMEDYYYKKFAAMETALAKLQQSTSSLSGLLGS